MEIDKKKYEEYVKRITPVHAFWPTLGKAFLTGGLICTLGQFINNWLMNSRGLEQEAAGAWTSLTLILLSVLLTGFNIYPKLVTFGGAGALVPDLPILWRPRLLSFTQREKYLAWDARFLPLQAR